MPDAISRRELLAGLGASGLLLSKTASAFTPTAPGGAGGHRALQDI